MLMQNVWCKNVHQSDAKRHLLWTGPEGWIGEESVRFSWFSQWIKLRKSSNIRTDLVYAVSQILELTLRYRYWWSLVYFRFAPPTAWIIMVGQGCVMTCYSASWLAENPGRLVMIFHSPRFLRASNTSDKSDGFRISLLFGRGQTRSVVTDGWTVLVLGIEMYWGKKNTKNCTWYLYESLYIFI